MSPRWGEFAVQDETAYWLQRVLEVERRLEALWRCEPTPLAYYKAKALALERLEGADFYP